MSVYVFPIIDITDKVAATGSFHTEAKQSISMYGLRGALAHARLLILTDCSTVTSTKREQ